MKIALCLLFSGFIFSGCVTNRLWRSESTDFIQVDRTMLTDGQLDDLRQRGQKLYFSPDGKFVYIENSEYSRNSLGVYACKAVMTPFAVTIDAVVIIVGVAVRNPAGLY